MQEEFYAVVFGKRLYSMLVDLQYDLDEWIKYYHEERPHSERYCYDKTLMDTFKQSLILARQKIIERFTFNENTHESKYCFPYPDN